MTHTPPMDWKGEKGLYFELLLRNGMPLTRIHAHFPECTYRQIEHRANRLIALKGIKRPKPLRPGPYKKKQEVVKLDFSRDNLDVGPVA